MRRSWLALVSMLLASVTGCTIQETGRADSMVADSLAAEDRQAAAEVRRAVEVARALRTTPDSADVVLSAHGMTRAELDVLLYRIAADPRLATLYERGLAAASADEL